MAILVCPAGAPDLPRPCSPVISTSSRFPSWPRSGTCPCAERCGWPRRSWNNASASCSSGSLPRCARTRPSAPTWTRCAGWDRELSSRRGRSDSARRRYTSAPRYWRQRGLVSCRERTAHDRSVPLDVRQLPRRRLDGRARFQQHRRRVPRPRHELVARPVGHAGLDDAVAEEYLLLFHVHRHPGLRLSADGLLEPLEVGLGGDQAGDAEHHAVAEEDLAEGAADDGADAPAHEGLGGVLARGAAAEVLADDEHRRALVGLLVEWMLGVLLPRVLEDVLAHALEGHGLQEARGDDAVGVDVVAGEGDAAARHLAPLEVGRGHRRISLTSVTTPVIAAAATMAGLINRVRPVGLPWRPMKLRLLEDALISRPWSLSSFMPRHMEQPALRHWKPAAWKIWCRPSASAALATC